MCSKGEIYWSELISYNGENVQKGIRPVIVIQNDFTNSTSLTIIVCPISSKIDDKRIHMKISKEKYNINTDSIILTEQLITINKSKLGKKIDKLDEKDMYTLDILLKDMLSIFKNNNLATKKEKIAIRLYEINGAIKYMHEYKLFDEFNFELLTERRELIQKYKEFAIMIQRRDMILEENINQTNFLLRDFKEYYDSKKIKKHV